MPGLSSNMPMHHPARKVASQPADIWTVVNAAASQTLVQPVVNLGMGYFGFNPPEYILDAAREALCHPQYNRYSPTNGRLRLRIAVAEAYSKQLHRQVDPETEVTITSGANEGILSACMAFLEAGDEVIVFEPAFDQHINAIEMAGGRPLYVEILPDSECDECDSRRSASEWRINTDSLQRAMQRRPKMMIMNSPQNPTGKVFSQEELRTIAALSLRYGVLVVCDGVYDRLCYGPAPNLVSVEPAMERSVLMVGSAGKWFYPTGWRVGWLVGHADLIRYVHMAHMRTSYSSVSPLQEAVAAGFERADEFDFWNVSRVTMRAKVRSLCEVWEELGIPYFEPQGGYFVVVDMARVTIPRETEFPADVMQRGPDFRMMWFLLSQIGVAAIPLSSFYADKASAVANRSYLRFAVGHDDQAVHDAKTRLRWLRPYIQHITVPSTPAPLLRKEMGPALAAGP